MAKVLQGGYSADHYEAVYGDMPRPGFAATGKQVPIGVEERTAAGRVGAAHANEPAVRDPGEQAACGA